MGKIREEMEKVARENAIKDLKELQIDIGSSPDDLEQSPLYYALDIAIKALEQETCEDCINKAEVINTIHKTIYGFFDIADDDSEEPINDKDELLLTINKAISNAVKALPSVKPQQGHGEWIDNNCSICGYGVKEWNNTPYCPNCGAKIEVEE